MYDDARGRKDHEIAVLLKDGGTRRTTYRKLLETLGLAEMVVGGEPMSAGTELQAQYVASLIQETFPQVESVAVELKNNA